MEQSGGVKAVGIVIGKMTNRIKDYKNALRKRCVFYRYALRRFCASLYDATKNTRNNLVGFAYSIASVYKNIA